MVLMLWNTVGSRKQTSISIICYVDSFFLGFKAQEGCNRSKHFIPDENRFEYYELAHKTNIMTTVSNK